MNILNKFFHSTFNPPDLHPRSDPTIPTCENFDLPSDIQLTVVEIAEVICHLDLNNMCGPGSIPSRVLQNIANKTAPLLCRLFSLFLSNGFMPADWKLADIMAVFKKDDPSILFNSRPISLLSIVSKVLKWYIFNQCYQHLAPQLYQFQHRFLKRKSIITQLFEVYQHMLDSMASGIEINSIYLDLSKAFDKVSYTLLVYKLKQYGISGLLLL